MREKNGFAEVCKNLTRYRKYGALNNYYVTLKLVVRSSKLFAALFVMLEHDMTSYVIILII